MIMDEFKRLVEEFIEFMCDEVFTPEQKAKWEEQLDYLRIERESEF
jgi:spermidine/putrescine-binding protein